MSPKMKNVFYFSHINIIGGIEQFFAYLVEKYNDWDINIVYKIGNYGQISRLREFANVIKYDGGTIECDKAFFCFNMDIIDNVIAKEYNLILHGDYRTMVEQGQLDFENLPISDKIDNYYGVSQTVCDAWKDLTNIDCKLIYNPYVAKPKKKILRLVYCGRLTQEKGGDLLNKFLEQLKINCVDYILYVYSDKQIFGDENVVYLGTHIDASQYLTKDNYDFIIVPSKNEGYCYSLVQALANGLPSITTPCPVFKELGVNKSNSIQLEFDGSNIDYVISRLYDDFKFTYKPKNDTWGDILAKGKSTYDKPNKVKVKALVNYYDTYLDTNVLEGQVYEMCDYRANLLQDIGYGTIIKEELKC